MYFEKLPKKKRKKERICSNIDIENIEGEMEHIYFVVM